MSIFAAIAAGLMFAIETPAAVNAGSGYYIYRNGNKAVGVLYFGLQLSFVFRVEYV